MTKNAVQKVLASKPPDKDLAAYLSEELTRIGRIKSELATVRAAFELERQGHLARAKKFQEQIAHLQSQCKHEDEYYCSDPSGNRDSHHHCPICDKDT